MLGTRRHAQAIAGGLIIAVCVGLAGCSEASKTTQAQVMRHYEAGLYRQAYEGAQRIARASSGRDRRVAQYLAGLSAYRLGRTSEALSLLKPVADRGETDVAGPAAATVGILYTDRLDYAQALRYMRKAEARLHGEDRARVLYQTALVEQRQGQWSSAQRHLSLALSMSRDAALRKVIRQRLGSEAFTLQFGAYSRHELAHRHAGRIRRSIDRARIGAVSVVPSVTERGERLYLVQAGRFDSQPAAAAARRRTGIDDAIVVPAD